MKQAGMLHPGQEVTRERRQKAGKAKFFPGQTNLGGPSWGWWKMHHRHQDYLQPLLLGLSIRLADVVTGNLPRPYSNFTFFFPSKATEMFWPKFAFFLWVLTAIQAPEKSISSAVGNVWQHCKQMKIGSYRGQCLEIFTVEDWPHL